MDSPSPPSPPLDNARISDHLANERTYLSWLRTGISTMGFGIVIARLRWLLPTNATLAPSPGLIHASNIGLLFTVFGLLTVILSIQRYLVVQKQIREGRYETPVLLLIVFTVAITILGLLIIWYLLESSQLS